jgi:hypothetical protein
LAKHIPANRLGTWLEFLKLEDIATQDYWVVIFFI